MSLYAKLSERAAQGKPVRVGLIGAGKFGAMYLAQVPNTPGVHVVGIADLAPPNARANLARVGWTPERYGAASLHAALAHGTTHVSDDWEALVGHPRIDVICDLVDWARAAGFGVVAAGRGHKWLPHFAQSTPETVWGYYGLTPEQAKIGGLNPKMFNSFLDGSKPAIESTAVCNATGLVAPPDGLSYPPASIGDISMVCRPIAGGGVLHAKGQVEVISSLERDGRAIPYDIRFGVFVVFEGDTEYIRNCFREYMVRTDPTGRYACLYKRWHLIGLEVGISVASVGLRGEATGAAVCFNADVVATAKRDLKLGETLDGEGGYTVWGKLLPAQKSLELGDLPLGLAHGAKLLRAVKSGRTLTWADVTLDETLPALTIRREMEVMFARARTSALTEPAEGQRTTASVHAV